MPRSLTNQASIGVGGALVDATHLEDSAHTTGDRGMFVLAVRSDASTALAGAGDYIPIIVDANGRIWVHAELVDQLPAALGQTTMANSMSVAIASNQSPVAVDDGWDGDSQSEETADDSDKTITVPVGETWQIISIRVELTTTATAGVRQVAVQILDGASDVIAEVRAGITQDPSLTYYYQFFVGAPDLTAVRDSDWVSTPIPAWTLPPGYGIRVWDNNAVDAAADDMQVHINNGMRTV